MTMQRRFSVRDALQGGGSPEERLRGCLVQAKQFLEATTPAGLLADLFAEERRRTTVLQVADHDLHVGFVLPPDGLDLATLDRVADQVGFTGRHATCASTIIARELGVYSGRPAVPTTIFMAHAPLTDGGSRYVEAFLPATAPDRQARWITLELGTHIGLTVTTEPSDPGLREAFVAEGFRLPSFMNGCPLTNPSNGATAVFYDQRATADGGVRIELLSLKAPRP
jgi:hypothetical protein